MGKPTILDINTLLQAGINPKTGLPVKFGKSKKVLKEDTKKFLRLIDEQDAVNRYVWHNLPCNITSQELERMLYYKGQLCFFYLEDLNQFFFTPYALDGTIDFYGRYNTIHPVPMTSGTEDKAGKAQAQLLSQIKLNCVYGALTEFPTSEQFFKSAVLLHDYTKQLSQTIIPRCEVNDPILDTMAECVPFMRTSLLLSTGIKGLRVADADQAKDALDASRSMEDAALQGEAFVPIVGDVDFQELNNGATAKAEEYMLAMQSLDNLRLSGYGLDNGGLFEKKRQILQAEADLNGQTLGLVMQDGLSIRQNFCNIVNSIWGLGIWVEPSENVTAQDEDADGKVYDDDVEGQSSGVETESNEISGGNENE